VAAHYKKLNENDLKVEGERAVGIKLKVAMNKAVLEVSCQGCGHKLQKL
jgi:hypothetical protein